MPSNKQTKSNKSTVESKVEVTATPVVSQTLSKGKKSTEKVAEVVALAVTEPVVEKSAPKSAAKSTGKSGAKSTEKVVEKLDAVVVAPVVVETLEGGGKTKAAKVTKATKAAKVPAEKAASQSKGKGASKVVKEAKAPKVAKAKVAKAPKAKAEKTETESGETEVNSAGKTVRSFKVRLPGNENFEGRFTGLTPYQAANKALSKYYRETEQPKKEIMFSIRESTRGSKRSTYTYNGQREKLKVPVEYSIKDGRTIVKNFKNRLVKVKKADNVEEVAVAV
jgi:hypothetical protein